MKTIIKSTILFCFISLSDLAFGVKDFDNFEKIHPLAVPSATGKYLQMGDYAQISSCTNWKNYFMFTKINTVFTFEIDPENTIFCNSGNDQVLTLEVSYSGIPFNPSTGYMLSPVTGSFTLKLVFNPISGKLETKKSTKILENFMKVTYNYVFKVDGTPYTSQCAPSVVFFVDHQSERNYKINTDFHNSFSNKEITFTTLNVEPCQNKNTLFVNDIYQNNTPGCNDPNYFMHDIPEFYELEYTFVDFEVRNWNSTKAFFRFRNNSTRVQFKGSSFNIPCIYPKGYIVYRIRMVAYDLSDPSKLVYSNWSIANPAHAFAMNSFYYNNVSSSNNYTTGPTVNDISTGAAPIYCGFMIRGHEMQKNWQYSIAFAEDAKNKGVISYFDGSLRNRQTITRMNAENNTIVGQTIYDWYGRPAISVLPVPADENQNDYCFKPNFNISVESDKQYDWKDFDLDFDNNNGSSCLWKAANAMKNTSGASKYYSQNNAGLYNTSTVMQSIFIPNAEEYPFAQTEFTPDASNRPSRQGGLGKTHQLFGNTSGGQAEKKFTAFSYEVPSQEELFLLFGNDIGNHEYYRKNITTDPNGQNSVTYIDPDGKTIATALLGSPGNSDNLEALSSSNDFLDIETKIPSESVASSGTIPNQMVSSFTKHFTEPTTIKINYDFDPQVYKDACNNNICYDCIYDLNVKIVDKCGNAPPERNFTVRVPDITEFDLTCSTPDNFKLFTNEDYRSFELEEGTYTIIKTLTVNKDAYEFYRDHYMADESCVKKIDEFIEEEMDKIEYSDCFRTCEVCENDVQVFDSEIANLIIERNGMNPNAPGYAALYASMTAEITDKLEIKAEMEAECKNICGNLTECDILLEQIKLDMMPGGDYAQYLKPDKIKDGIVEEITDANALGYIYRGSSPKFQSPKNTNGDPTPYKNKDGSDAYIEVECVGTGVYSPPLVYSPTIYYYNSSGVITANPDVIIVGERYLAKPHQLNNYHDFIDAFKKEWVEQLIHYHPELCMWSKCVHINSSYKYDMDMMNTDIPTESINKGFLNPLSTPSINQGYVCDINGNRNMSAPLNYPAFSSPFANDPIINANPFLKQHLLIELQNYNTTIGTPSNYTIWELYYIHLVSLGIPSSACLGGEGWEYFRTLYLNAKRNVLAKYYYDYDSIYHPPPNYNWCATNVDQTLSGNSTIKRKFFYRKSDRDYQAPPAASSNYDADLDTKIGDQCHDNCLLNIEVWMDKLEGCGFTPTQRTNLEQALLSVCERSCDGENVMGGQKAFPDKTLSYVPNTTREAILAVMGKIVPNICDDILLTFPTTYDEDPYSTNAPEADTCACNPYATGSTIRIGCDQENLPSPPPLSDAEVQSLSKLENCICPLQNEALKTQLMMQESIPENKKCQNCINCDELAIGLIKFFQQEYYDFYPGYDPSPSYFTDIFIDPNATPPVKFRTLDYTQAINQKIMEGFFNKYFGFNLTYQDYLDMAKKCMSNWQEGMDDNDVWENYFNQSNNIPNYKRIPTNHASQHPEEEKVQIATCGCDKLFEAEKLVAESKYPTTLVALQHLLGKQIQLGAADLIAMKSLCCDAVNVFTLPDPPLPPVIDWFNDGFLDPNKCTNANYRPGNWSFNQRSYLRDILTFVNPDPALHATLLLITDKLSPCKDNYFTPCPKLCNKPKIWITEFTDPCVELLESFAMLNAKQKYIKYLKDKEENFKLNYYAKCMTARETENLPFIYQLRQYHYTLYYYDQAGNLSKTVPPAGVDIQHWFDTKDKDIAAPSPQSLCSTRIAKCWAYKNDTDTDPATNPYTVPNHRLITCYQYNTLNQLARQDVPDAGHSLFWYDKLGRLVISQNNKQYSYQQGISADRKFSYTVYNNLGLILEVGEIIKPQDSYYNSTTLMSPALAADATALAAWLDIYNISLNNKTQVTRTVYNKQYIPATEAKFTNGKQSNLRNRVVSLFIQKQRGTLYNPGLYEHAVHYSYDIHGNVKEMVQEVSELDRFGKRWSNITYEYDLISGNVNQVNYQPGKLDAYHHRYTYDGDNRLVEVQTSQEGRVWEKDARYQYYQHGPLARTELGQEQVQGIDYAYTLSGWLKAVNGDLMDPENDIGKDGTNLIPVMNHSYFARDIFGYTLGYYNTDYAPVGILHSLYKPMQIKHYNPSLVSDMEATKKELFNGNINNMTIALPDFATFANGTPFTPKPVANTYRYDQLNRITKARFFDETTVSGGINYWKMNSIPKTGEDAYYSTYQYDANGNITHLTRKNSGNVLMDNLTYRYNDVDAANTGKGKYDNKLYHVNDAASTTSTPEIKDQGAYTNPGSGNYKYDEIGNLTQDASEKIEKIEWNVYGKISKIVRDRSGSPVCTKPDLEFVYDGTGNRLIKKVKPWNTGSNSLEPETKWQYTYYLRDAQGNTMAVYSSSNDTTYRLTEHHIYGSSRLGMQTYRGGDNVTGKHLIKNANLVQRVPPDSMIYSVRGLKHYELSNHLGNVQATVSDRKLVVIQIGVIIDYYLPDVQSMTDYYPFGMVMDGRNYSAGNGYRFAFNGQEKDDEVSGPGNTNTATFWEYDTRLGRRWNLDPKPQINISDYACFGNNPILYVDILGDSKSSRHIDKDGKAIAEYDDGDNNTYKHQTAKTKADVDKWRAKFGNTSGNGIAVWNPYINYKTPDPYKNPPKSLPAKTGYGLMNDGAVLFGAGELVYKSAEAGLKTLQGGKAAIKIGQAIGIEAQQTGTALKGTLGAVSKVGKAAGVLGYGIQAVSIGSKVVNGEEISTAEGTGFGISSGLLVAGGVLAGTAAAPFVAAGALIYGTGQLGSYLYNGKTLEENIIGE